MRDEVPAELTTQRNALIGSLAFIHVAAPPECTVGPQGPSMPAAQSLPDEGDLPHVRSIADSRACDNALPQRAAAQWFLWRSGKIVGNMLRGG